MTGPIHHSRFEAVGQGLIDHYNENFHPPEALCTEWAEHPLVFIEFLNPISYGIQDPWLRRGGGAQCARKL